MFDQIRLLVPKTTVASGAGADFPSASGFYDTEAIDLLTIVAAQAGATARTVTLTFADKGGNVLFTIAKALAATTATKILNVGSVCKAGGSDFLAAGDDLAQAMALPPKVRVSVASAAVNIDVTIIGRG